MLTPPSRSSSAAECASEVAGIDVLLSGHTHNRMDEPLVVNGATIIQSGCHGSFVGRLDVEIGGGKVAVVRHELIPVDDTIPPDREMQEAVEKGGRAAFSNGWRYGAPIPADPVTAAHVAKVLGISDPSDVAPSSRCSRSGSNAASSSAPPRRSRSTSGARAGRTWPTKATG